MNHLVPVDLKTIPASVAAPMELNSSSVSLTLPIKLSRLQYINAVKEKTQHTQAKRMRKHEMMPGGNDKKLIKIHHSLPMIPKLFATNGPRLVQPFKTLKEAKQIENEAILGSKLPNGIFIGQMCCVAFTRLIPVHSQLHRSAFRVSQTFIKPPCTSNCNAWEKENNMMCMMSKYIQNNARTRACSYEVRKCKALWLQAREALWSN